MSNDSCGPNDQFHPRLNQQEGSNQANNRMFEDSSNGSCGFKSQGFGHQGFGPGRSNYQSNFDGEQGEYSSSSHGGRWNEEDRHHGRRFGREEREHRWDREMEFGDREGREHHRGGRFHHRGGAESSLANMDPASLYNFNGAQNTAYDFNGNTGAPYSVSPDAGAAVIPAAADQYSPVGADQNAPVNQNAPVTGDQSGQPAVDNTLIAIAHDAQTKMSPAGFNNFVAAVESAVASGQGADDATIMQQVMAQLQQQGTSQADLAALQTVVQTDLANGQAAPNQPPVDATLTQIGQDAQSTMSADGFNAFAQQVQTDLQKGQPTDTATLMQQVVGELQQAGTMSQADMTALQAAVQKDLAAGPTANNQPTADATLTQIGQDAQSTMTADGFNAFAQQVQTDLQNGQPTDTATLMQQVVGELQQAGTMSQADMTALQAAVQKDLAGAAPTANNQPPVDATLTQIGQDAQSTMTADGFNAFAQQVQTDLQNGQPADTATLMQQVLGQLQQAGTVSAADMTALQAAIQKDLTAAAPANATIPTDTIPDATGAAGLNLGNPTNNAAATTDNGTQPTVDATVNQIGVDAQQGMTPDGFNAFVTQLSTDMQNGQGTDDATLMQQVFTHLQQAGTVSQADLTALQNVMQTDLQAAATANGQTPVAPAGS